MKEPLDLGELVEQIVADRARTLPPGVRVVLDLAANVSPIAGERGELELLVSSLLELWLAAAEVTGGVTLVVDRTDDSGGIRLEVMSTAASGPALPPRLDQVESLRIILAVVGRHEGTLRVWTTAGATHLEIVFPRPRASERAARCRRPTQPITRPGLRSIH